MKPTGGAIAAGRVLELATLVRAAKSQSRPCLSPLKPGQSVTSRAVVTRRELVNFSLNGKQVQLSQSRFASRDRRDLEDLQSSISQQSSRGAASAAPRSSLRRRSRSKPLERKRVSTIKAGSG